MMTITCKEILLKELRCNETKKFNFLPINRFSFLTNLFNCDKITHFKCEYSERELKERAELKSCVGWQPEIEYTKLSFQVAESSFFINKVISLK